MARVLIVDDSMVMRRNLKVILTQAGHEVVGESKKWETSIYGLYKFKT